MENFVRKKLQPLFHGDIGFKDLHVSGVTSCFIFEEFVMSAPVHQDHQEPSEPSPDLVFLSNNAAAPYQSIYVGVCPGSVEQEASA